MKFTVNRRIMLEYLKSMIRVVPKSSPVKELTGFLIEANEDDGCLCITANNTEAAIQRKFKPTVETGGEFVMDAKLLTDMLSVLGGTDVTFEEVNPGMIKIKSENCVYSVRVLSSRVYPRPEMPFPDDTLKITGLKQMYAKTCATAAKGDVSQVLSGIHIDIAPEGVRMVSCDLRSIAVARKMMQCGGSLSFTLPKASLSYLAGAIGNDDELEVGISGSFVVFMKKGMMFSARLPAHEYVNIDTILNSMQQLYMASVEFDDFKPHILNICDVASMSSETSYIKLLFQENRIEMETKNDIGSGSNSCKAVMIEGNPCSFYYPANMLKDIFRTVEGTLIIQVDKRGYMLVFDRLNKYMLTPIREEFAEKQAEKFAERKKAVKTKPKLKTESKAA